MVDRLLTSEYAQVQRSVYRLVPDRNRLLASWNRAGRCSGETFGIEANLN
jgi:hypothetical protein